MTANATPNLITTALAHAEALEKARAAATQGEWHSNRERMGSIVVGGLQIIGLIENKRDGYFAIHAANSTHATVEILRGLVKEVEERDRRIAELEKELQHVNLVIQDIKHQRDRSA